MKKLQKYAQTIAIIILSLLLVYQFQAKNAANDLNQQNLLASQGKVKTYKDKLGRVTIEVKSYVLTNAKLLKQNDSLKETIRNIKPVVVVRWKTKFVNKIIEIPYDVEIPYKFDVPWENKTEWFSISGRSTNKGITINNIDIPNKPSLVVGYKRDKFLGPKYAIVTISNTNPKIINSGLESYIIKPKKGLTSKWYFWTVVGGLSAFILGK